MGLDAEIIAAARAGFMDEALDNLRQLEQDLLQMEQDPGDQEAVHGAFRAAHTLKGAAGMFGLDAIVRLTHALESTLDALRDGSQTLNAGSMAALLAGADELGELVAALQDASPPAKGIDAPDAPDLPGEPRWRLKLRMGVDALRNGLDPLSFIRHLGTLGTLCEVRTRHDRVPTLETLDAESCWLDFEILLQSSAPRNAIVDVFDFLQDDCELDIQPESAVQVPAQARAPSATTTTAPNASPSAERRPAEEGRFIRVRADKLDRLVDLIGELVIAGSGANNAARESRHARCIETAQRVHELVQSARDGALALRMVPIGQTFSRFQRVVRDVGKTLGKEVGLQVLGGDTELDRALVDAIADPLMHLVRNAMDHGLETAEERLACGKPAQGTLTLNACHESGSILIRIADDGRGIQRDKVLRRARERGLVEPGVVPPDEAILDLIFAPGFSTAEQVTNLSGRGVGMDVVRSNVQAMRGSVTIQSEPGQGACIEIRLPLTLAIIDGFLVGVGPSKFIFPLDAVVEVIASRDAVTTVDARGRCCVELRGQVLPVVDLRSLYALEFPQPERSSVVVVRAGSRRYGVRVDTLLGQHQTVIKPLGLMLRSLRGVSGSSILGTGEVALIFDVGSLGQLAATSRAGSDCVPAG